MRAGETMAETAVPTPPGFGDLTKAEQVRYLQALWDHISQNPNSLPFPESHLRLAENRLKLYRKDPSRSHSAFEVLGMLTDSEKSK
jgi:hypothetical protein